VRRTGAYTALSLGLILLFIAPLARWYTLPRVKKIPTDYQFRAVSVGTATYLDPSHGFQVVGPVRIENVHQVRGDVDASTKTVAVWDSFDSTWDVDNRHELSYAIDRYTFDRVTGRSVDCCGQNEDRTGALTLLMPIGIEPRAYQAFWDSTAKRAFPIEYERTTMLQGLTVYLYHQHVAAMQIGTLTLPGKAVGDPTVASEKLDWMYTAETDVWAEPVTGAIIKASQAADQWLQDTSGIRKLTIATTNVTQTPDTTRRIIETVSAQRGRLQFVQSRLPVFGPVVGILLVALGLFLVGGVVRSPPRASESAPAAAA
jgi:DUF3068 family protein